jgi:DNA helicase-2/ATP-dependent DNA helicase PcrA
MQAEGLVEDGVELSAADLPVVTLGDYLENVSLLSAVDVENDEETSNKITLMTVHSSKGLEFPYVYVAGMEENLFPSGGFMASETEIEEERRLFYVAMTRAKTAVQFSFASTRMRNGKHESNSPSRFIKEVDSRYIENPLSNEHVEDEPHAEAGFSFGRRGWGGGQSSYGRSGAVRVEKLTVRKEQPVTMPVRRSQVVPKSVPDADFEPTPILQLRAGQRIEHNRFGFGQIVDISGNAADLKARISFDDHGEKILILKYAKIRVVQ